MSKWLFKCASCGDELETSGIPRKDKRGRNEPFLKFFERCKLLSPHPSLFDLFRSEHSLKGCSVDYYAVIDVQVQGSTVFHAEKT